MKKAFGLASGFFLLFSVLPVEAGGEDNAILGIMAEALRAHTRFLADDLLEGRGTATRGHDIASKYVAAQFEAMGLEPGNAGSFFQPIRFRSAEIDAEQTELKLLRGGSAETLVWGEDFICEPDSLRTELALTGRVVFVGNGVVAPDFRIDDYQGLDVRGKVVALLLGQFSNETKLAVAQAHGAIGVIALWNPEAEKMIPFAELAGALSHLPMAWIDDDGVPNEKLPRAILGGAVLSDSGTKKLFAGAELSKGPALAVPNGDSLRTELPVSVSIRTVSKYTESTSQNVVAILRGSDPKLRNEYVVYTAHLDGLGIGKPVNGDAIYNGAIDDAAGVAAVIEIARAFQSMKQKPRRSIIFIATTGEEKRLLGSDYYARHPTVPVSQIVADINIDSIDLLYDFRNVVVYGSEASSLGSVVDRVAAKMGLEVSPDSHPEKRYFFRSDQYSFFRVGVPSIFPGGGDKAVDPKVDVAKISRERAQRYHQPSDDLNQPMDFEVGAKSTRFDFLLGYTVAQDENRPVWKDGDFFGKTFGKGK
jgi:hypothetical protein